MTQQDGPDDDLHGQIVEVIPNLRAFARSLVSNPSQADDLVQGALTRALSNLDKFEAATLAIPGVMAVDHTHSWSIDGQSHVLTTHLVLRAGMEREEILACKAEVRRLLDARTFEHVTIDVELEGEDGGADSHRGSGPPAEPEAAEALHAHHHH